MPRRTRYKDNASYLADALLATQAALRDLKTAVVALSNVDPEESPRAAKKYAALASRLERLLQSAADTEASARGLLDQENLDLPNLTV